MQKQFHTQHILTFVAETERKLSHMQLAMKFQWGNTNNIVIFLEQTKTDALSMLTKTLP